MPKCRNLYLFVCHTCHCQCERIFTAILRVRRDVLFLRKPAIEIWKLHIPCADIALHSPSIEI